MKTLNFKNIAVVFVACVALAACKKAAKNNPQPVSTQFKGTTDSITQNGFTLRFVNTSSDFAKWGAEIKKSYIETFFTVYPKIVAYFNPNAPHKVTIMIDTAYDGIAYADTKAATIHFDPQYPLSDPGDWNVITHESTHVVQQYNDTPVPGWMTEGIADYSRVRFGVKDYSGWVLPEYSASLNYTDGYSTVARFLYWTEAHYHDGIAQEIDKEMRAGTYSNTTTWIKLTGSDFTTMWTMYTTDPSY